MPAIQLRLGLQAAQFHARANVHEWERNRRLLWGNSIGGLGHLFLILWFVEGRLDK